MNTKALAAKLIPMIESCEEGTAQFLEGLQRALESVYADSEDGCPEGFAALSQAIEAFRAADEASK